MKFTTLIIGLCVTIHQIHIYNADCEVNTLQQIEIEVKDELAETAWNLGTEIASNIPFAGPVVGIFTSVFDPTEDDGPSAAELVNDVRKEINNVVTQLKDCLDAKIINLDLEWQRNDATDYVTKVTTKLKYIAGADKDPLKNAIEHLFRDFDSWIVTIFKSKDNYLEYENLIPIYQVLLPLWSGVAQDMLTIKEIGNDCKNYQNVLNTVLARYDTFRTWINKAMQSITSHWNDHYGLRRKYEDMIENYIYPFDDLSPSLRTCANDGTFVVSNIVTLYQYEDTKYHRFNPGANTYVWSANAASKQLMGKRWELKQGVERTLYAKQMDDTLPVYKYYDGSHYFIAYGTGTMRKCLSNGEWRHYKREEYTQGKVLISVLGYCSTLKNNPPVSSCESVKMINPVWIPNSWDKGCPQD